MRLWALLAYGLGIAALGAGWFLRTERPRPAVHSLERARLRGEVSPDVPRLDANDAMANAALLNALLAEVPHPDFPRDGRTCQAPARSFAVKLQGRLSRVRFGGRSVCQLRRLKEISVAAFVLGRRMVVPRVGDQSIVDVDVSRIVVPPFRIGDASLTFAAAELGPLSDGEFFIGTYHTHPEGDVSQGVLSETDLDYMRQAVIEFAAAPPPSPRAAGRCGSDGTDAGESGCEAKAQGHRVDWLFDIVDPKEGDWNVYAHDRERLSELAELCSKQTPCPLNELRIAGSRFHLLARSYDEREEDAP
jgi:hypothetical protein